MSKNLQIFIIVLGLILSLATVIISVVVLLFGDNFYTQFTGQYFVGKLSKEQSQQLETPMLPISDATPTQSIKPTTPIFVEESATLIEYMTILNLGSSKLLLTPNQVAIGTADRFHDVIDLNYPPFTIFVIYGSIDVYLSMFSAGWDLWENASEIFIDEQINDKIQDVISDHPTDYYQRGYRVIKCYGQVDECYIYLGTGFTSAPTFYPTTTGGTKIFTHSPTSKTIQYESICIDDELQEVELVCADGTTDIKELFTPFTVANEELLHYRSSRIELKQNCRIDFAVKDTKGDKIGMQVKLSVP